MAQTLLDTPVLQDDSVRYVNFFNGRQLSAEDLERERDAARLHQQHVGRSVGYGVVDGLAVTSAGTQTSPILRVSKGLAVNRQGQTLSLSDSVDITLGAPPQSTVPSAVQPDAGLFGQCKPPAPQLIATGTGLYVLLMGPTSVLRDRAPKVGLRDDGIAGRCDFAWAVEAVEFTVRRIDPAAITGVSADTRSKIQQLSQATPTPTSLSMLQDEIAHAFIGSEAVAAHYADPWLRQQLVSPMTAYGHMDAMWASMTSIACYVPLAILLWTSTGLHFVELWGVRRRPAERTLSQTWPVPTSGRRVAEGEAAFFHFQDQVTALIAKDIGLSVMQAREYFRYLPPAGILPLRSMTPSQPIEALPFFAGRTVRRPVFIAEASVEPLIRDSLAYPPIDLTAKSPRNVIYSDLVWLYQVRENERARPGAEPYLVFTTGHMPFYGHARLDVSWFDYSNYSSVHLGAPRA